MSIHRRRLPHIQHQDRALFITFRLAGSLPNNRTFKPDNMTSGAAFAAMDRLLDTTRTGPFYLRRPELAGLVIESLERGESTLDHYALHAYVVMPNHVHLLLTPKLDPSIALRFIKGSTARRANQLLALTGQPFWQDESYDHWVRDEEELRRIRRYIENNPVRAALCATPEQYPWSSASAQAPTPPH
jgi:hypothetical protein